MKKIIIGIVLIVLGFILITLSKKEQPNEKPTVKIGVSLPMSGSLSYYGVACKEALNLALQEWQDVSTKYKYQLIFEDNQYDSKRIAMVANKLVNVDKVNAFLTLISKAQLISTQHTSEAKVINMGSSWGSEVQEGLYNINNNASAQTIAETFMSGFDRFGIKKVAIVEVPTPGVQEYSGMLEKLIATKQDMELTFVETIPATIEDYSTLMDKIKIKKPDIIVVLLFEGIVESFAEQIIKNNINIPITTLEYFTRINKELVEGLWYVKLTKPTKYSDGINEDVFGVLGTQNLYDNLNILINAFEEIGNGEFIPDNEDVVNHILNMKTWSGLSGESKIYPDGTIDNGTYLAIIKNGKIQVLEE